tara:strand:- start:277 stop:531 length:255 start_codon:yes stop_codon:yes gene_type:complete
MGKYYEDAQDIEERAQQIRSYEDHVIEEMLHDALADVKELSKERSRRIQIKFAEMGKNTIDMFTEYQESLKKLDPMNLRSSGKI